MDTDEIIGMTIAIVTLLLYTIILFTAYHFVVKFW